MKVRISHLAEGHHTINLTEAPEVFGLDDPERFNHSVAVVLEIDKRGGTLYTRHHVQTTGNFCCDRCLEPVFIELQDSNRVIYSNDHNLIDFDDDVRYLSADQSEIDITDDVRNTVLLAVPAKILCRDNCKGYCPGCGVNLNQGTCQCEKTALDPRWAALKKLVE